MPFNYRLKLIYHYNRQPTVLQNTRGKNTCKLYCDIELWKCLQHSRIVAMCGGEE
jgi:hypothetical protein